jgi:tRNA modification GTPase
MLLEALVQAGARQAEAGEFTARAYFNGRMDLSAAEGVAATIAAHSESELRAARQLMAGELARRLRPAIDELTEMLALLEAGIDFSDEDISFISTDALRDRIARLDEQLAALVAESARYERLTHEATFVLVGKPNAGKSTLLNALAGHERAVVSPIAGTTRDVLSAEVVLVRGVVRVMDVAGIENDATPAGIERDMSDRAARAAESADFVILVSDTAPANYSSTADLVVHTKADLAAKPPLAVSALTGHGLAELRRAMDDLAFGRSPAGASLALNARHLQCIAEARAALDRVRKAASPAEITALELRDALDALGRVLGQVTPDEVLGRIFSTFCIGK